MSNSENLAAEPKHFLASPAERVAAPPQDENRPEGGHSEINARRSRTENPDALRRLRSL